jgi:hypothetical protein
MSGCISNNSEQESHFNERQTIDIIVNTGTYHILNIFLSDNNKISCTITSVVDPDPYWDCGPGSRSIGY